MKERPILFSGPMVRAILAGNKTQTRCLIQPRHLSGTGFPMPTLAHAETLTACIGKFCHYGVAGDRLFGRETWYCDHAFAGDHVGTCSGCVRCKHTDEDRIAQWREELYYRADGEPEMEGERVRWRPSIFMPRWASRLTLEILAIRVQRLQDISEEDAKAEGVDFEVAYLDNEYGQPTGNVGKKYRGEFSRLWDAINGARASWASNPWVWAVTFKSLETIRA